MKLFPRKHLHLKAAESYCTHTSPAGSPPHVAAHTHTHTHPSTRTIFTVCFSLYWKQVPLFRQRNIFVFVLWLSLIRWTLWGVLYAHVDLCVWANVCVCLKLIKVQKRAFEESVNGQRLLHKVNMHKHSHMHTMHGHAKTHTHIVKLLHVLTLISSVRSWFMGLRQLRSDIKL